VSLARDVQPIFNDNCVICHTGTNGPVGLSLDPAVAYSKLVGVKSSESPLVRVSAGAPDNSYIIKKLTGTQAQAGGSGEQMPFGRSQLPQSKIDIIKQWISEGALNN
jgi:mono/diheme cytochrome c family protein